MHTLEVKLRDHANTESNLWMAEDAFGYDYPNEIVETYPTSIYGEEGQGKNILIVDDINDTGATLDWIIQDWQASCLPNDPLWDEVWGNNVRFAVLIDNLSSNFSRKVDYSAEEINKAEKDVWIVYPWER
jgi:hypoxanthine phosphoribosyltransferase